MLSGEGRRGYTAPTADAGLQDVQPVACTSVHTPRWTNKKASFIDGHRLEVLEVGR